MENNVDDIKKAVHALSDELAGVTEYSEMAIMCEDPELKRMATDILMDEKKHAHNLLKYIQSKAQSILS